MFVQRFNLWTLLTMLVGAVTLTTARSVSLHKKLADDPAGECRQLAGALYRVYQEVLLPVYDREQVKAEIKTAVGIDPDNMEQLTTFACGLQGAKSIKDLSHSFLMPYGLVQQLYQELMEELSRCGGVQGCQVYMSMMNDMADWLHSVKYGKWPLQTTPRQTEKFLLHMAGEYGKDFLNSPGLMSGPIPQSPLLINKGNARTIAKSFSDSHSVEDMARISGYPKSIWKSLDEGLNTLAQAGKYVRRSNKALKDLLIITDEMGLVYLPNDSRSITGKRNSLF